MSEALGKNLRRNTRISMLAWAWSMVLITIRMLMLVHFLDLAEYGLWILSFSIMNYFVIYNFGLANSYIKYTAECNADDDFTRMSELMSTGMVVSILIGAAILGVLVAFTDEILLYVLEVGPEHFDQARFIVVGVGVTTALNIGFSVYSGVLVGVHRLDVRSWIRIVQVTVEFAVLVVLLNMGYGLKTVLYLHIAGVIATLLLQGYAVHRLVPKARFNPFQARWSSLPEIISLGSKMQLLGMVAIAVSTFDIVVFTRYGGLAFMGVYAVAQRFARRAQGAAQQGFGALAPASADLFARKDYETLGSVYRAAQRITAVGCIWIFAYLVIFSEPVMRFVMHEKYMPMASFALAAISMGLFVHSLTGPGSSLLRGAGMPFREMLYQMLIPAFFLPMFFMVREMGNYYAIATWPVARALASLVFIVIANRFFRVNPITPFNVAMPIIIVTPILAWLVHILWQMTPFVEIESRWAWLAVVLITGAVYSALFWVAAWNLPGLSQEDKNQVVRFVPGGHRLLKRFQT